MDAAFFFFPLDESCVPPPDKQSNPTAGFVLPTQSLLEEPQDLPIFVLDEAATPISLDIALGSTTLDFFELPTELVPLPVSAALET